MSFSGLGLPPASQSFPGWAPPVIRVVEQALYEAWQRVTIKYPGVLSAANEDAITDRLKAELVALRRESSLAGFNCDVFQLPVRDAKLSSGAGSSIDMMPDLSFHLAGCRAGVDEDDHDGFFVECKVIDSKKGLSLYDRKGLVRFVDGRYASRMPHAGVIAYALGTKHLCPVASLPVYLGKTAKGAKQTHGDRLKWKTAKSTASPALGTLSGKVWESVHGRELPGHASITLAPIAIRHLWLRN